jgi:hypothetical protein
MRENGFVAVYRYADCVTINRTFRGGNFCFSPGVSQRKQHKLKKPERSSTAV